MRGHRRLSIAAMAVLAWTGAFGLLTASCGSRDERSAEPTSATGEAATTGEPTTTAEPATTATESGPLVGIGDVELVSAGYQFTEGPQWMPSEALLLFTDNVGIIYQLAANDEITEFRKPSNGANGLAIDPQGRLLAAEASLRRVTRTESDGTLTPIAELFEGAKLNQPNDIAVRSDGTIYFTDPLYADYPTELSFRGVFRVVPDGTLTAERRGAITEAPNGIALSPDETRLYVANWADDLVWVFDVAADGSLSEARKFVDTSKGPDGIAVDQAGNLFVATSNGIEVFSSDGAPSGVIPVPETPANLAFGGTDGRTLYITAETGLYRVTLVNPGPY